MSRYTSANDPEDGVDDADRVETDRSVETDERAADDDGNGDGFWDLGVVATLVVVGLALVVFPEPATTITGVLLLAVGVSLGVLELVT